MVQPRQGGQLVLDLARHLGLQLRGRGAFERGRDLDGRQSVSGKSWICRFLKPIRPKAVRRMNSRTAGTGLRIDQEEKFTASPRLRFGCAGHRDLYALRQEKRLRRQRRAHRRRARQHLDAVALATSLWRPEGC